MEEKKQPVELPPLEPEQIPEAIEAIVFAAGYPVKYDKLAEVLNITTKEVKATVKTLAGQLENDSERHGIRLMLYPTACQLATKEQYASYIREALGIRRGGNLSASSMEVLAVIAYNQPTTRTFVDMVRGVDSSYAVGSLLDKGLIEAAGRLDAPGRPMLYVTTDKFLRVFGIRSLDELPETEALSVAAQAEQLAIATEELSGAKSNDETAGELPPDAPREYTEPVDPEENDVIFETGAEPLADDPE